MRATPGAGGMRSLWPALRSASSLQSKPPTRIFSPGAATGDGPRGQEYCLAINFLNFFTCRALTQASRLVLGNGQPPRLERQKLLTRQAFCDSGQPRDQSFSQAALT
jgi:hypothetical protein